MTEEEIVDIWNLFKEYIDKKQIEVVAEKYVDLLADYGVSDETLVSALGTSTSLDEAINYYLDSDGLDDDEDFDDEVGGQSVERRRRVKRRVLLAFSRLAHLRRFQASQTARRGRPRIARPREGEHGEA